MDKKMIERGVRLLREYLNSVNDCLSAGTRKRLFAIIEEIYREFLEEESFYMQNYEFLRRRRLREEKDAFFFDFMCMAVDEVKARYCERHETVS